ncbi:type 1 glutamine amidotransferase [Janibacter terrae]|uniref:type 1 glutamine amidotransferase n=1 Tax=Janibacter terrae TaxID=103817 RepID=UPI0031F8D8E2
MSLLVVQHQETCPPALVGTWLTEAGVELDVRRPYVGDALPSDLEQHDGLLVLGGEMGCRDDDVAPWLPTVRELIRTAAERATPTMGICLGHQLAAVALGGDVARNPRGRTIGVCTVSDTGHLAGDPVLGSTTGAPVAQWNDDIVTALPEGAVALAANEHGDLLLARLAPTVWGVQGHPEADLPVVARWAAKEPDTPAVSGTDVPTALAEVEQAQPRVAEAWRPVVRAFVRELADRRRT